MDKIIYVYHGSVEIVRNPEIRLINRPMDFGIGFYVTTYKEQAEEWAKKRAKKIFNGACRYY